VDNCKRLRTIQIQRERREFTTIGTPEVGDELHVHSNSGVRGLVCRARGIIACLASGDVVQIEWPWYQHAIWKKLGIPGQIFSARAVCKNEGNIRDSFVFENGLIIDFTVEALNRNMSMRVLSLVPRDHDHNEVPEYDGAATQRLLDGVPLPASATPVAPLASRCGELVHAQ
jgi:hypothetical protein